jgi:hypothetical protein
MSDLSHNPQTHPVLPSSYPTMRPLSATEAIGPAIERTRDLLTRPFRWRTFLKIAAVAFFAELGGSGLNFNTPGRGLHGIAPGVLATIVAFAVIFGVIVFVVGLILLYLGSRLQLVLVDLVATRQTWVAPSWRKFSSTVWRWIGLKLLFWLCLVGFFMALASPVVIFFVLHHRGTSGIGAFAGGFTGLHLSIILLIVAAAIIVILAATAAYLLLRDFVLPSFALEDVSISEGLRRMRSLLAAEPGQVALFLLLKFILLIVFGIAGEILIFFTLLISAIPFGLIGGGLWYALHNTGSAGTVVLVACAVVGGIIFFCWAVCLVIAVLGSVYVFSQSYALYFLGGRYPLLGDLLDRSTPPPAFAYATPYPYPPPYYPPPPALPSPDRDPNS